MKNKLMRQFSAGTAVSLTLLLGCTNQSAQTETPRTVQAAPAPVLPPSPAPAVEPRGNPGVPPADLKISAGLAEIVKLAQAGVSEEVMLAYVNNSNQRFSLGSDEIVYLNDLGVASPVITAMIQRDGKLAATQPAPATPVVAQSHVVSNVAPPAAPAVAPTPVTTTTTYVAPPQETSVSYFYESLSPYGSWVNVSGIGMCWQPTVAVTSVEWRPYSDRGRWLWSDSGWYWQSDYSWGWAAFHYGRWHRHDRIGWVWAPDINWGPAWVSWRYTDTHCGWAPLPPAAHYVSGVGFSYYDRHVGVSFDFGLTDFHYTFISLGRFCDYSPHRYYETRNRTTTVYKNSTVINNYIVGNNNTIINNGVGHDKVAKVSQTPVRTVAIRETPVAQTATRGAVKPERMEKEGNALVVYRPQLPKASPAALAKTAELAKPATLAGTGQPVVPHTAVAPIIARGNNPSTTPPIDTRIPATRKIEPPAQPQDKAGHPLDKQPHLDKVAKTTTPVVATPAPVAIGTPVAQPQPVQKYKSPAQLEYQAKNPQTPQPNVNNVAKVAPPTVTAPAPVRAESPAHVYAQPQTPVIQPQPEQRYQSPAQLEYRTRNPQVFEHRPAIQQPPTRTAPAETYRQPVNQDRSTRPDNTPARTDRSGRQDNSNGNGKNDRNK